MPSRRTSPPPPQAAMRAAADVRRLTPEEAAAWAAVDVARMEGLPVVDRPEDVPAFADEADEVEFWDTHQMGPNLEAWQAQRERAWGPAPLPSIDRRRLPGRGRGSAPPKQPAPVSLRLEADTLRRLRALAAHKGTRYQTLLKQFVVERLYEEEKREGLAG